MAWIQLLFDKLVRYGSWLGAKVEPGLASSLSISTSTSCSWNCILRRKLTSSWCESCLALQLSTCETVAGGLLIGPPESLIHPRWGNGVTPGGEHYQDHIKVQRDSTRAPASTLTPKEQLISTMGSNHLLPQKVSQFTGTMAHVCFLRTKRNFAARVRHGPCGFSISLVKISMART